jgi:branched-chain amino acid transport system substrate-binding protein
MTETIEGLASNPISRRGAMLGFGAGASLAAMPWIARAESETIRIGFPVPLTGPFAAEARDQVKSAELAVKLINDKGGGGGRKVELLVRDDKLNAVKPRPARSN